MAIAIWACISATLLGIGLCWAMFARPRTVPPGGSRRGVAPKVSVVVPARNEEAGIGRLLRSLGRQEVPPYETIVVDDCSEDQTSARAERYGARVVSGEPPPPGWVGKSWACQQGAGVAGGDWLLFLDADTEFEPGGFERLSALAGGGDEVHSVCPYHAVDAPYEQLSAFFNAVTALGVNAFTWKGDRVAEVGLFGQVLLVSRRRFEEVGGYARVKGEVLENFQLARHFRAAGVKPRCWLGRGCIRMRMYPGGLAELVAGWSKGAVAGAGSAPKVALAGVSVWLSALSMASMLLVALPFAPPAQTLAIATTYCLAAAQVGFLLRKLGAFSPLLALLFPVGLVFYHLVFARALWRKGRGELIQWKGRYVG